MTSNALFSTPQRPPSVQTPPPPPQQQHQHQPTQETTTGVTSPTHGLPYDAETMQQQMEIMLRDEIYASAQLLGEFLVSLAANLAHSSNNASYGYNHNSSSATTKSDVFPREFHAKSFRLFGDLLVKRREYRRAIQYYKRYWKLQMSVPNATLEADAIAVKVKIAQCWIELENTHQAIEVLHSVPAPSRSLNANLLLGKLYMGEGLKNKAEESYRAALRQNPYALEASLALADLAANRESTIAAATITGSSATQLGSLASSDAYGTQDIERFYAKLATMRASNTKLISRVDATWLQMLMNAHVHAKRGRYRLAMEAFESIERLFPNNLHCLLYKGKLEMEQEFYHQAHLNFNRARQVDDQSLTLMDAHADCLRKNGARVQLNNLVHDLFAISEHHAEPWLAAAYLSDMKGEQECALQFCERAILTDRRYAPAHLFRGVLLLQLQRPEHALMAFSTSCKLVKSIDAFGGIIMSYCDLCLKGINKYKEALTSAKTVVKLYPQRAQSYTLLGSVFALRPDNREQAKKAFQRALSIEPRRLAAVFGLVDLLVREGNVAQAVDKLVTLSEQCAREEVWVKLADVYTLNKQFGEAMTTYHRALSLNPTSSDATRGLERLEKIMRGEDPDRLNTTMEEMDPDDHDDSMEAGEYGQ